MSVPRRVGVVGGYANRRALNPSIHGSRVTVLTSDLRLLTSAFHDSRFTPSPVGRGLGRGPDDSQTLPLFPLPNGKGSSHISVSPRAKASRLSLSLVTCHPPLAPLVFLIKHCTPDSLKFPDQ
jgi:hypothetical protein